ncbi:hypothetical protein ACN47A_19200 [Myxococcus fulvus]|uniref:hypothetical protein n=1 Tax=Myxococcus fulvus TaxID=33 RepID=UPI003B9DB0C7
MTSSVSTPRGRPAVVVRGPSSREVSTTPVSTQANTPNPARVVGERDSFTSQAVKTRKPDLTGAPQAVTTPLSPKQQEGARYVQVPVYANDTQWHVVLRGLPMLAKQAGLSPEGQKAFCEKWSAKLHASGEMSIYSNGSGQEVGDFKSKLEPYSPGDAARPQDALGTYSLEFLPGKHAGMFADLRQLQQNEALASGIGDPQLRSDVLLRLNQLSVSEGEGRLEAAQGLLQMAGTGQPEADKVYQAVQTLAASESQKTNASLKLVELRLDLERQQRFIGPRDLEGDKARMLARIDDVAKLADRRDAVTGKATPDRLEAAFVNQQASVMLKELGDAKGALHREMMGRFYEVGPEERAAFENPGLATRTVPRWRESDTPMMRATTPEEAALRRFERENGPSQMPKKDLGEDPQKLEVIKPRYTFNTKTGKLEPSPYTRFQLESSVRVEGEVKVSIKHHLNDKGAKVKKDLPYTRGMIQTKVLPYESGVLNPGTVSRARNSSAGVGAIEEFNKWGSFLGDLVNDTTAKKVFEREKLQRAAKESVNFPVPPRPEDLPALRPRIELLYGKEQAPAVMRKLEELSVAFYGRSPPATR